jgi:hypothetical protein
MEEILQHKQIQDTIYEKSTQQTIGLKKALFRLYYRVKQVLSLAERFLNIHNDK